MSSTTSNTDEFKCSLDDITTCPSAQIIKILLKKLEKLRNAANSNNGPIQRDSNELQNANALHSVIESHDYSVTKLLDDIHHLKYEHGIDRDVAKFDAAYDFFKDTMNGSECNIDGCPIVKRHYRDRGARENEQKEIESDLLLDTMSMIHVYLLRSFDTQRLTKDERERVMKMTGSSSWLEITEAIGGDDADSDTDHDDVDDGDDEKSALSAMDMITDILKKKKQRGRGRFREEEEEQKAVIEGMVDFAAMAGTVGVDEKILRGGLSKYEKDRDKLLFDLIDAVYSNNNEELFIWSALKMEEVAKGAMFQMALYEHFHCFQLNTANLIKLCRYIVARKRLQIDVDEMEKLMNSDNIDGQMFDKGDIEHYQNMGTFAKRFKEIPDCKLQHVRQLYGAVKKWKYVEVKKVVMESKEEEKEDEVVDDDPEEQTKVDQSEVYAIGNKFFYWKSQKRNPDYVQAKYKDIKEEVMQSPLIAQLFPGMVRCNELMETVNALVATKAALKVKSNGKDKYIYNIKRGEPFDSKHMVGLKLYTDYTKLCSAFCIILRRCDRNEIGQIANWARTLTECVQCFGSPLHAENVKKTYFRGVNKAFMFVTIVSKFNLPQSTTSNVEFFTSIPSHKNVE